MTAYVGFQIINHSPGNNLCTALQIDALDVYKYWAQHLIASAMRLRE